MKKNKNWFSLVIAMWIVLVSSLLAYTILEYMLPFSRNIKWIENSTKAYYKSNSWLEKWLYFFSTRKNQYIIEDTSWWTPNYATSYSWYIFSTFSSGSTLPEAWNWNSEYDSDWNTISVWNPIQLSVWYDFIRDLNNLVIKFRTPEINWSRWELKTWVWYISWQLVWDWWALYSNSWSLINWDGMKSEKRQEIRLLEGSSYTSWWSEIRNISLGSFFQWDAEIPWTWIESINCDSPNKKCILKFSVIRDLETDSWLKIPYLEWRVSSDWPNPDNIPLRYSIIDSTWKSGGFARKLKIRYPQETVNQAFDFAVFQ